MSSEIRAAGKTFNIGEEVEYEIDGQKKGFIVMNKSQHEPPGLILKNIDNQRQFAISAATVAAKIKKKPTPKPTNENNQQNNNSPNNNQQNNQPNNYQQAPPQYYQQPNTPPKEYKVKRQREQDTSEIGKFSSEILMFFAFLVIMIDVLFLGASLDGGPVAIRIGLYAGLVVGTAITLNIKFGSPREFIENTRTLLIIAAVPSIMIPAAGFIAETLGAAPATIETIGGLIIMAPVYQAYLFFNQRLTYNLAGDTRGQKIILFLFQPSSWLRVYFGWLLFSMLALSISYAGTAADEGSTAIGITDTGFDTRELLSGAGKIAATPITSLTEFVTSIVPRLNQTYHQIYNETLGEYYTGQVEQNRENTGVFIRDITTMGTYYEGQPVELFANIEIRSFVDEVNMTTSCYAYEPRNPENIIYGETDPKELKNVFRQDYRGVKCKFNETQLDPVRYTVVFEVDFNFETWAYTTLTLMDRDFLSSLYQANTDIHRRYNINPRIRTIYTNGPVMLGMNDGMEMPLGISTSQTSSNMIPLGITIDDRRQTGMRGEIRQVNSFELRAPPEFIIDESRCMIPGEGTLTTTQDGEIGYMVHSFDVSKRPGKYLSISCNAEITQEGARSLLSDPTGKTDVTIAGSTTYDYYLRRQEDIRITPTQ